MKVEKKMTPPPRPGFVTVTLNRNEAIMLYALLQFTAHSDLRDGCQVALERHGITQENWRIFSDRLFEDMKDGIFEGKFTQNLDVE